MEYITFKVDGTVQEEIKKSKFICHVKRVSSEEEARDFINAIKKEHYKATHNCSAFIIGEQSNIKRTSDDGEPSGTAGIPMLGVLENHHITNSCVVVTRYFGGIKLGSDSCILWKCCSSGSRDWTGRNQRTSGPRDYTFLFPIPRVC